MTKFLAAQKEDGSLERYMPYIWWAAGVETVCLDGHFTAADLRAIADHMDKYTQKQ